MSFFRNVVLNFKNKDDVEEYLEKYQELVPTQKGVGLEDFFICRLSDTSLLTFCTIDTEENGQKIIEFADKWREENKFEILSSGFDRIPTSLKKLTKEQEVDVNKLLEKIEDDEDVQNVYHNMQE